MFPVGTYTSISHNNSFHFHSRIFNLAVRIPSHFIAVIVVIAVAAVEVSVVIVYVVVVYVVVVCVVVDYVVVENHNEEIQSY